MLMELEIIWNELNRNGLGYRGEEGSFLVFLRL